MGYQFIHVESYARTGAKTKDGKTKKTIREILDEVQRVPGNIPHILTPRPPKIVFGCVPALVEALANEWASQSTDACGRKIRSDGLIMLAGVASIPRDHEQNFEEFTKATVAYLLEKYGDRLKSVVVHEDEAHPHLHFYVLPKVGEKFEDVHEGFKAAKNAARGGKLKGEQNKAYIDAMRAFQDEFSAKVAMRFGLARLGPGRRRLTREAWKAEKAQAKFFANAREVSKKGYWQGFKKGKKIAAAENEKMGEKIGAVLGSVFSTLHKPTLRAEAQIKQLKNEAEKLAEKNEQKQKQTETKNQSERNAFFEKLATKKREVLALETDLKQAESATAKANEIAAYYEKKFNEQNTNLSQKSKAVLHGGAKI